MSDLNKEERIAKLIAGAGVCSRRDAEKLIAAGRVTYKNEIITTPAAKFLNVEGIKIDGKPLKEKEESKIWLYHKPVGLVVSHNDEQGRETVFDHIPLNIRVISIGRLDKNTSGLLLLTNDGALARKLELPQNKFERVYRVRVYGNLNFTQFQKALFQGLTIDGIKYQSVKAELETSSANNHWLYLTITEGKNREIRKILDHFNLKVSKLIRVQYGSFVLGNLQQGRVIEIPNWQQILKNN